MRLISAVELALRLNISPQVFWEISSWTMLALEEVAQTSREFKPIALLKSVRLTPEEVFLWEVSEETLWYYRMALGLMEPEERSC